MTFQADISDLLAKVRALRLATSRQALIKAALAPSTIKKVQVYLTREMDKALRQGSTLQEGQTAVIRGQTWAGWKTWTVEKYGAAVVEGTRFYFRKFRRDADPSVKQRADELKAKWFRTGKDAQELARLLRLNRLTQATRKGTMKAKERKAWEKQDVAARPFEKVWRTRASNKRYSSSSKLMLDTGRMRQSLMNIRTSVHVESSRAYAEFRPGAQVAYFERQNALRPIWVWNDQTDLPVIQKYVADELTKYIQTAMRARA